eukprot:4427930-Amphidinium_carterae.5
MPSSSDQNLGLVVELFALEAFLTAEFRLAGANTVAFGCGRKIVKPAAAVFQIVLDTETGRAALQKAIQECAIVMGTWPTALPEADALVVCDILECLPRRAVALLLFQRHDTAFQLLQQRFPRFVPFVASAGTEGRPIYRRIGLSCGLTLNSQLQIVCSIGSVAGDGMPRKWARAATQLILQQLGLENLLQSIGSQRRISQPGHKRHRLIPEFKSIRIMTTSQMHWPGDTLTLDDGRKAKVLEVTGSTVREHNGHSPNTEREHNGYSLKCGVWHTVPEFLEGAKKLLHPFDRTDLMPERLSLALANKLTCSPSEVARRRLNVIKSLWQLRKEFASEETDVKKRLPAGVRGVLKDRQVHLFDHLLKKIGFTDRPDVVRSLWQGADITTSVGLSSEFPDKHIPAVARAEELRARANTVQDWTESSTRSSGDDLLDQGLVKMVEKDLANGWAVGPFRRDEVTAYLGFADWVPSRRFGVWQGQKAKVRAIDDFTASGWNGCVGVDNRWTQHTLDDIAQLAMVMHRWIHAEMLSAEVDRDTVFKGCAHSDWTSSKGSLVGTTIDLEAAFRQLPLSASSGPACPICYFCCSSGEPRYICLTALPFGSVASVAHFL